MGRKPDPHLPLLPLILDGVSGGLERILTQEGIPWLKQSATETQGQIVLWDSRRKGKPNLHEGQQAINIAELTKEAYDPFGSLLEEQSSPHLWRVGMLELQEQIARVAHRQVRRKLLGQLRRQVEQAGGVWLRIAAFPFPYRSVFNFRIDYDEYHPEDFEQTFKRVERSPEWFSHFICGSAYEPHPAILARFQDLDTGGHGYWHHTYRLADENLANIRRGLDVLEEAGIESKGFVAPHGKYNAGLREALEELGLEYSSEFSLAYDELPFFPQNSQVLQLPVHPVCLGLFLEAAERSQASLPGRVTQSEAVALATDYFVSLIRQKYSAAEPILLYGHPTGRLGAAPEILDAILETVQSCAALWKTTLREYANWWQRRGAIQLQLHRRGSQYTLFVDSQTAPYRVGIEYCRGDLVALFPLDEPVVQFNPASLAFQKRHVLRYPSPTRIDRRESLKERFRQQIDWEKVTPAEEISDPSWRGWTKWMIRRLQG
ncbi:Hypothetical protein PBC10988_26920 [Planctomycetales bacterium 10988]|nr:Hypothetical protein PBC10988_26920 [Planctomycetales bacterium 10988]